MAIFGRGPLKGLFGSASGAAAAAGRADPSEDEHGTIEDWFVRTAKTLLGRNRSGTGPRPSRLEQKLATLEQQNATLREDNRRLADEVTALRTLVFVRQPAERE